MGCVTAPGAVLRTRIAASCFGSGYTATYNHLHNTKTL